MKKAIYFDMDGTIADLYNVKGWLDLLRAENATPYKNAKPMLNMSTLARTLNRLTADGWTINVVTWTSKNSSTTYHEEVKIEKINWLKKHLKSVKFSEIVVEIYGKNKSEIVKNPDGILFDDEENNRKNWKGESFDEKNILENLKSLLTS